MPRLSTFPLFLFGCSVHLGTVPVEGRWSVATVDAPVAEPDVDAWMAEALAAALASRGALDPSGPAVTVTVTDASFTPARRAGDTLLYDARLTIVVEAGGRTATRTRTWSVVDPGDAAGARALREATFRTLARQVADDAIAHLLAPGSGPAGDPG